MRPETQVGITVVVSDNVIMVDGVRDSAIGTVKTLLLEESFTQALSINGHVHRPPEHILAIPTDPKFERYWDIVDRPVDPDVLRKLPRNRSLIPTIPGAFGTKLEIPLSVRGREPFPWPPPEPSGVFELPHRQGSRKVDDLVKLIQANFKSAGYPYSTMFPLPGGGAAIVSPVEQTDAKGNPLAGYFRFSTKLRPVGRSDDFGEYLNALISGRQGNWRVIVFVITDQPLPVGQPATAPEVSSFGVSGNLSLAPPQLQKQLSAEHRVWGLVYEISARENGSGPIVVLPGRISGEEHIRRAGLYKGGK